MAEAEAMLSVKAGNSGGCTSSDSITSKMFLLQAGGMGGGNWLARHNIRGVTHLQMMRSMLMSITATPPPTPPNQVQGRAIAVVRTDRGVDIMAGVVVVVTEMQTGRAVLMRQAQGTLLLLGRAAMAGLKPIKWTTETVSLAVVIGQPNLSSQKALGLAQVVSIITAVGVGAGPMHTAATAAGGLGLVQPVMVQMVITGNLQEPAPTLKIRCSQVAACSAEHQAEHGTAVAGVRSPPIAGATAAV
jgi:hypothetical protein